MDHRDQKISAQKLRFLEAIAKIPNVTAAARAAGIVRQTPYKWADADDEFKTAWTEAIQEGVDRLEEAVWDRAVDGVEDYVVSQGKLVYIDDPETGERKPLVKRVYSDALAARLLEAHRPEKFSNRVRAEVTQGGPIKFTLDLGRQLGKDDG